MAPWIVGGPGAATGGKQKRLIATPAIFKSARRRGQRRASRVRDGLWEPVPLDSMRQGDLAHGTSVEGAGRIVPAFFCDRGTRSTETVQVYELQRREGAARRTRSRGSERLRQICRGNCHMGRLEYRRLSVIAAKGAFREVGESWYPSLSLPRPRPRPELVARLIGKCARGMRGVDEERRTGSSSTCSRLHVQSRSRALAKRLGRDSRQHLTRTEELHGTVHGSLPIDLDGAAFVRLSYNISMLDPPVALASAPSIPPRPMRVDDGKLSICTFASRVSFALTDLKSLSGTSAGRDLQRDQGAAASLLPLLFRDERAARTRPARDWWPPFEQGWLPQSLST